MNKRENTVKEVLGPGIWLDLDNTPHFNIPRILEHLKLPTTSENVKACEDLIEDFCLSMGYTDIIKRYLPEEQSSVPSPGGAG